MAVIEAFAYGIAVVATPVGAWFPKSLLTSATGSWCLWGTLRRLPMHLKRLLEDGALKGVAWATPPPRLCGDDMKSTYLHKATGIDLAKGRTRAGDTCLTPTLFGFLERDLCGNRARVAASCADCAPLLRVCSGDRLNGGELQFTGAPPGKLRWSPAHRRPCQGPKHLFSSWPSRWDRLESSVCALPTAPHLIRAANEISGVKRTAHPNAGKRELFEAIVAQLTVSRYLYGAQIALPLWRRMLFTRTARPITRISVMPDR